MSHKPYYMGNNSVRDSRDAFGFRYRGSIKHNPSNWLITWKFLSALLLLGLAINMAFAQSPQLYDRQTGKYLGNLSANSLDPNSVNNPLGRYGNPLSPDSIRNRLGEYGSPLSNKSVTNPLATQVPVLIAPQPSMWRWGAPQ